MRAAMRPPRYFPPPSLSLDQSRAPREADFVDVVARSFLRAGAASVYFALCDESEQRHGGLERSRARKQQKQRPLPPRLAAPSFVQPWPGVLECHRCERMSPDRPRTQPRLEPRQPRARPRSASSTAPSMSPSSPHREASRRRPAPQRPRAPDMGRLVQHVVQAKVPEEKARVEERAERPAAATPTPAGAPAPSPRAPAAAATPLYVPPPVSRRALTNSLDQHALYQLGEHELRPRHISATDAEPGVQHAAVRTRLRRPSIAGTATQQELAAPPADVAAPPADDAPSDPRAINAVAPPRREASSSAPVLLRGYAGAGRWKVVRQDASTTRVASLLARDQGGIAKVFAAADFRSGASGEELTRVRTLSKANLLA